MNVDFALIGHMDDWEMAASVLGRLRGESLPAIASEDVREILPWIPARTVCHVTVHSIGEAEARGVYIDSFIPPDELQPSSFRRNLERVREAALVAIREGASVAALGGFSSILLEGDVNLLPHGGGIAFTTGNTLTVAYIVKGLEEALRRAGRSPKHEKLLIVGATGDVGSGAARYFADRVEELFLCARNGARLRAMRDSLAGARAAVRLASDAAEYLPDATMVICAASLPSPSLSLKGARRDAIVCDAGYPKNLRGEEGDAPLTVFSGGMGQVRGGLSLEPDLADILSDHPFPRVVQGCLLEGMLLALERRFDSYSRGRGLISTGRIEEIWDLAQKHGFTLAPFFNGDGPSPPYTPRP